MYTNDDARWALNAVVRMLQEHAYAPELVDTIVSLGSWPQNLEHRYREAITPYQTQIAKGSVSLIFGDSLPSQLRLLEQGLANANIGQNPYQMGYQAIESLIAIHQGKSTEEIVFTPLVECLPGRQPLCADIAQASD